MRNRSKCLSIILVAAWGLSLCTVLSGCGDGAGRPSAEKPTTDAEQPPEPAPPEDIPPDDKPPHEPLSFRDFVLQMLEDSPGFSNPSERDINQAMEAVARRIAQEWSAGGEQVYILPTGELTRVKPKNIETVQDYTAYWMYRHRKERRDQEAQCAKAVMDYPSFEDLAATSLYGADTKEKRTVLAQSIAATFTLGGEIQGDMIEVLTKGWVRELPDGVTTVEHYVDFLLERATTPGYAEAVKEIGEHPELIEEIYRKLDEAAPKRE